MQIIEKKIDELIPYINNPRKNDKAVDLVASSIKNFGFKVPIVIDGKNEIIAGHTRWKASKKLGLESVPCIVADDLTENQIKAFRLADNKVSEASQWDLEMLVGELISIEDIDMLEFGFKQNEFNLPDGRVDGEVKFTEVLGEEHNYVVLYFDNAVDWLQAESLFDLKTVKGLHSREGFEGKGVGRVLNGSEAIKKIRGGFDV